ncbi:Hydroxymethylpyrimidine pyrophosphatase and other HAD family phosphatases (Cof) [Fructobacillus fructosus]|uniref:HAD-IIB family hydrolase n=2 Tax=Fructobacillus fructosus TaxID=1631 RepID=UPI00067535F4|nr:HAD family hydrolase [Fructobacillus fructosus]KRN52345.1 HAD superfamily hydrolase [Fructobacillus fructosus KCTC 3544]GAP01429.1 HAD hydrolase, family IIB [Fructobacillus fructosus]CAK1246892.1 Hydroxymethylpyrimidine pyrophosphatase and other HAD family phosphatases (Cof) [Fructobacillus fructosus]
MTIKLIASDMDGTFLANEDQYDQKRFAKLLKELKERDVRFVAASGRRIQNLRELFAPMGNQGLLDQIDYVGSNGSVVQTSDEELYAVYLTAKQIEKVIEWNSLNPQSADNLIVLSGTKGTYVSNHASQAVIDQLARFYPNVMQVEKLLSIDDQILGVSFIWPHDEVQKYVTAIEEVLGHEIHVTGSGFGSVDILPKDVNKANALAILQKHYGISDDEVMVFGDNSNDLEMLKKYQESFLMPNAAAFMHQVHDREALATNEEAGVIKTIEEKLNLSQK